MNKQGIFSPRSYLLPTLAIAFRIANHCCDWCKYLINVVISLRMLTNMLASIINVLMNDANVLPMLHWLAISLRMMRIFDDEGAIGINTEWICRWAHCFLEFKKRNNSGKTFAWKGKRRTLQTPYKYLTSVANASEYLTNVTNGLRMLTKIDGKWQYMQHSLKFRTRFLYLSICVSRWRMTCERSEFVINAYKYSASVASFERMTNIFIRKHIRNHIRLCVRAV